MSKYKVEDVVLLEGQVYEIEDGNNPIYRVVFKNGGYNMFREKDLNVASKTYEDGLADAWELARKICEYSECNHKGVSLVKVLDYSKVEYVIENYTYQQALAKIEAYEKSQLIQVGDVVECFNDYKGVVLNRISEQIDVFTENGCVECLVTNDIKKTNKHLDIEHLLEQIRGNE